MNSQDLPNTISFDRKIQNPKIRHKKETYKVQEICLQSLNQFTLNKCLTQNDKRT